MKDSRIIGFGIITIILLTAFVSYFAFSRQNPRSVGDPVTINEITVPPVPRLDPKSVARGEKLYLQYCASCHGINLEGKPNWKEVQADGSFPPPPHDNSGHTWHHPDELLIEIIANGGDPNLGTTKMPGFGDQLTEAEIVAILDYIKSHWEREDREFQWWITAREEQPKIFTEPLKNLHNSFKRVLYPYTIK
jgi:mono/diheme cytochrome c family protein